ncbi:MAG: molybdopterin cofactor-binding domain-containing protein, partial [Rhodomicrobium sp.]
MSGLPSNLAANPILSRWVTFGRAGTVTICPGKVELGQGVSTALVAIAAKELGMRPSAIEVAGVNTVTSPNEGLTAGSFSIEHSGAALRYVCAIVRSLFEDRAQAVLSGKSNTLDVSDGVFSRLGGGEGISYWDLNSKINLDIPASDLPAPVIKGGTANQDGLDRIDLETKLSGAAFIQDMTLPGMLYGRVLRPAHPNDRLVSVDLEQVKAQPGVVHVALDGGFFAVAALRDEQAAAAIEVASKTAVWDRTGALPAYDGTNGWMAAFTPRSTVFLQDEEPAAEKIRERHAASYTRPYLTHASIGPSCAIAEWSCDRLKVWSHTQGVYPLRGQLARVFGLSPEQVQVFHVHGAGCYGHNAADDVALDAALLARSAGAPVMCLWSRADELSWSPFGAAMRMAVSAGLDEAGTITEWNYEVWSPPHVARPGIGDGVNLLAAWHLSSPHAPSPANDVPRPSGGGDRNAVPIYSLGKRQITHHLLPQGPLRSSALRSLGAHGNIFTIESFMDELANLAGIDPVQFRLKHLEDERGRAVVQAAAQLANWDTKAPGGDGLGRGIGLARYKNSAAYCAVVADVEVTDHVTLRHVWAAVDAGLVVHRDGLLNQIEGGIVQAASWTLKEFIGWTEAGFSVRSWADYPILKFSEIPQIEINIIEPPGEPSLGAGECATGPTAAAIGNAVAHALGVRVRDMP